MNPYRESKLEVTAQQVHVSNAAHFILSWQRHGWRLVEVIDIEPRYQLLRFEKPA